jgi:hypothetical protein
LPRLGIVFVASSYNLCKLTPFRLPALALGFPTSDVAAASAYVASSFSKNLNHASGLSWFSRTASAYSFRSRLNRTGDVAPAALAQYSSNSDSTLLRRLVDRAVAVAVILVVSSRVVLDSRGALSPRGVMADNARTRSARLATRGSYADPGVRGTASSPRRARSIVARVSVFVSTVVASRWSMTPLALGLVTDAHADRVVGRRAPNATASAFSLFDSTPSTPARVVVVERVVDIRRAGVCRPPVVPLFECRGWVAAIPDSRRRGSTNGAILEALGNLSLYLMGHEPSRVPPHRARPRQIARRRAARRRAPRASDG